jgi:N-acetylneuraminic acid mutarotase
MVAWTTGIALVVCVALGASVWATSPSASGKWTAVAHMNVARGFHTLTVLPGNRVLAVGGIGVRGLAQTAEVYDVARDTWTLTAPAVYRHAKHAAAPLADGRVLVTGGVVEPKSAEIYDPSANTWTAVGMMAQDRHGHTATTLRDGRVLIVGNSRSTEIFDPTTGVFSLTGNLNDERVWHTATMLPDGNVMVAGGKAGGTYLNSSEVYDVATGAWTRLAPLSDARMRHTAVLTSQGVMVVGGFNGSVWVAPALRTVELYNLSTKTWSTIASMNYARREHAVAVLHDGSVIAVGGESSETFYNSAERFSPIDGRWTIIESRLGYWPAEFSSVTLADGRVLVAGGTLVEARVTSKNTEIFSD